MEPKITAWRQRLHKHGLGPGQVAELEQHLRDTVDELLIKGYDEERAFEEAVKRIGNPRTIARQEWNVNGKRERRSKMPVLVPAYFTQAWRHMKRAKLHSLITVAGLVLGMAGCILLAIYVQFERSYDTFHDRPEQVYRYMETTEYGGAVYQAVTSPNHLAYNLRSQLPGLEAVTAVNIYDLAISAGPLRRTRIKAAVTDSAFNGVFTFPMTDGHPMPTIGPNEILLSRSAAIRLFGEPNPVGKTLTWHRGEETEMVVKGVMEDIPGNSHFRFDMTVPYSMLMSPGPVMWGGSNGYITYFRLSDGTDPEHVAQQIHRMMLEASPNTSTTSVDLQPLTAIHLESPVSGMFGANGDKRTILLFAAFSLIILCIACVNHAMLSMARYVQRLREWGMRKVLGADRKAVALQLAAECLLVLIWTVPLALLLTWLAVPQFGAVMDRDFGDLFPGFADVVTLTVLAVAGCVLLSGLLPAALLYRNHPMESLRGRLMRGLSTGLVQRAAVVAQFAMTAFLLVYLSGVMRQMDYVRNVDLGFDPENLVSVRVNNARKSPLMAEEVRKMPGVESVSVSGWMPTVTDLRLTFKIDEEDAEAVTLYQISGDHHFFETLRIPLTDGRAFNPSIAADTVGAALEPWNKDLCDACPIIMNLQAAEALRLDGDVVGSALEGGRRYGGLKGKVIGTFGDIKFFSLHRPVIPMIVNFEQQSRALIVRYRPENLPEVIERLRVLNAELFDQTELSLTFFDEHLRSLYKSEEREATLITASVVLALVLSVMGLLGMVVFSLEQRTKEIGIRKVLGASVSQVIWLLTRRYVVLILVGCAMGLPFAHWLLQNWLDNFAFRADPQWWTYAAAVVSALAAAWLVIALQAGRAALANPVKALRSE